MAFVDLVDALITDPELRRAIDALLAFKRQVPESEMGAPIPAIQAFLQRELVRLEGLSPMRTEGVDYGVLDEVMVRTVGG